MIQADRKLCMIPGPVEFHEDVLAAMGTPATSHVSPEFIGVFGECFPMLREVLFTERGQPFVLAGSGTLGWEQVGANLIEEGDKVLVLNTGYFGDGLSVCLETFGAKVTQIKSEIGSRPTTEDLKKHLAADKYKIVTVTHVDTSTGVLSDVKEVARVVKEISPETLVIVDGVCSVGSEELRMDDWNVDVVVTASQKAIGVPPGLSIVVVSEQAMGVFRDRKTPIRSYYSSWARWLPIMQAYESRKGAYFATPAVQLIFALNVSLKQLIKNKMDIRFAQHREVSAKVKNFVTDLGLKLVPKSLEVASNSMTAVYVPEGVALAELLPALSRFGVVCAGGLLPQISYFRIGHMNISVTEPDRGHIEQVLYAVKTALEECGYNK
ncbi:uncharacterized protein VTP21DRAFT_2396 [Calcarisporiella thermophila]|uniref:uncharacterized protein n=1 Tax=Calcarisporiella thermophila TaxID=911321 RepID=UPI003744487E